MVGTAVKVTLVPAQITAPGAAVMLTDGVTVGFTVTATVVVAVQPALVVPTTV